MKFLKISTGLTHQIVWETNKNNGINALQISPEPSILV